MDWIPLVGRVLMAMIFLASGLNHFTQYQGMVQYAQQFKAPAPKLTVPLTGVMILLGGLSVLLGYRMDVGLILLVAFLLPAAFWMHKFWGLTDPMMRANQMAHFMKNVALAGAALWMWWAEKVAGAGPFAIG